MNYPTGFFLAPVLAWASMAFKSRTSNPSDPCFIGKIGDTDKRSHPPVKASTTAQLFRRKK